MALDAEDLEFPAFDVVDEDERPADEAVTRGGRVTADPVTVQVDVCGQHITIHQDPMSGCGGNLWHAALFMCHYLDNATRFPPGFFDGKRAIELGAGTGLVGITLLRLGVDVVLTDQAAVLPLLRKNVSVNVPRPHTCSSSGAEVEAEADGSCCPAGTAAEDRRVCELNWGSDCSALAPPFDYIFAADCVYHEAAFEPLLATLQALTSAQSVVFMSFQKRRKADNAFFVKAKKHFVVTEVDRAAVPGVGPRSEEFRKTRVVELRQR